jgi:hypothetical protein
VAIAPSWSLYNKVDKLVQKHRDPRQLFCVPFLNINECTRSTEVWIPPILNTISEI